MTVYTPLPVLSDLDSITPDTVWNKYIRDNFAVSPAGLATAKGDMPIATASGAAAMLAAGTNTQIAESDSTQATGVKNSWGFIPVGGIIMWAGPTAALPANWQLCNGTNGTPNLRDRFVVGAGTGGSYSVGSSGGANTLNLQHGGLFTEHVLYTSSSGAHTHAGDNTDSGGGHTHTGITTGTESTSNPSNTGATAQAGDHTHVTSLVTGGAHVHVIGTSTSNGAHTHKVLFTDELSATQNIMPPYYALAYIQRLS